MIVNNASARPLRTEEHSFLYALLRHVSYDEHAIRQLAQAQVSDLNDGGMGSVRFLGDEHRRQGACLAEAEYTDCDGVPVSIALNVDEDGRLYELDMWKVDFAPLREYPTFNECVMIKGQSEI
ncbi:DUF6984 family protein [Pseudoduganella chitinolytica]|uniref:DUF6984 domain-containing protein n=1 Tax=Pseudoduganella chitinolytica TaxID=34070 RepID=A0ABY8B925_9BURK|nr:hypothetical protein [Pseudoduganella chitinolytica]WEF32432.1 hypothetical protein PX653_23960 [Pseudoduganella chitinolytica]